MQGEQLTALERSLRLLGPLEARIMRTVWTNQVRGRFTVHDMQAHMPELAYTTVMTTLRRLADKGLLTVEHLPGRRAHAYRAVTGPEGFLLRASRQQVEELVDRFGPLPPEVDNLLQVVSLKRACREAGVEKLEAGPKGMVLQFRGNSFRNPAGLIGWLGSKQVQRGGGVKLRPDHKLAIVREMTVAERVHTAREVLRELNRIADQAKAA